MTSLAALRRGLAIPITALIASAGLGEGAFAAVPLVLTGEVVPGTGGATFEDVFHANVSPSGDVVFWGSYPGGNGIFLISNGVLSAVVLSGDPAPGGGSYGLLGEPIISPAGHIGFVADDIGGYTVFVIVKDGVHSVPLHNGDPVPGTNGGRMIDPNRYAVNSSGDMVFRAYLNFGTATPAPGILRWSAGSVSLAVLNGDPAPGTGGGTFTSLSSSDLWLDDAGRVALASSVLNGSVDAGLFLSSQISLSALLLEGDAAPGTAGGSFAAFGAPILTPSGALAFLATIAGGNVDRGVFALRDELLEPVVFQGDPAPDTGGGTYGSSLQFAMNDAGDVALLASVSGGTIGTPGFTPHAVFQIAGSTHHAVAVEGGAAPVPGGANYTTFYRPAIDAAGNVVFVAVYSGVTSGRGIFLPEPTGPFSLLVASALVIGLARHRAFRLKPHPRRRRSGRERAA